MKGRFEKHRIQISQLFVAGFIFFVCTTSNYWETQDELVTLLLFFTGLILVAIAAVGRLWCAVYISGYKDNKLICEGPYSVSRNPLYFFSFIGVIGVGFVTETFTFPVVLTVFFAFYYPSVIKAESRRLSEIFPQHYHQYATRVPAFFPNPALLKEPASYVINPVAFKKSIFSALWFIWITGILELIEGLKEIGVLHTYWTVF